MEEQVTITQAYYDSSDADNFYHSIWGGEDIHIGIYESEKEEISVASQRTVRKMAEALPLTSASHLLDIGAGYGGSARYLAKNFQCKVTALNLSETENKRHRQKNRQENLEKYIDVVQGNFESLPFPDQSFDFVWSQDAILHSSQKQRVFQEVYRVLKPQGTFIFTDPMQADDCPEGVLQPILERIHLEELGSVRKYRHLAAQCGFSEHNISPMPEQLSNHYRRVLEELEAQEENIEVSQAYLSRMKKGLQHWIEGGRKGYLNWGILQFKKT